MWVTDYTDGKLYAYDLETKLYDRSQDFNTLIAAGNTTPWGAWSNGTTMWISDASDRKLYAYNLATKAYDSSQDFNTLDGAGNDNPRGLWSDGTTMWVADTTDDKLYAYNITTKARDSDKDFTTLAAAGNTQPVGLWSDGTTMWVADTSSTSDKLYAYNLATKARDSDKDFDTLINASNINPRGLWSDGTTMWVVEGRGSIYAYNLATKARDSDKDFSTLGATVNDNPEALWSDGTTMWVATGLGTGTTIYAYNLATKARDLDKDFDNITRVVGLWSDGTTMWVSNPGSISNSDYGLKAYNLITGARDSDKDFPIDRLNANLRGIWSNDTTMWVANAVASGSIYAYNLATKARDSDKDFTTLEVGNPRDLWSDGTTMWVVDSAFDSDKLYAYNLATKARDSDKDFNTLDGAGNDSSQGLWSDGTTMWVSDISDDKLYAYNLATKARDSTKEFSTLGSSSNSVPWGIWAGTAPVRSLDLEAAATLSPLSAPTSLVLSIGASQLTLADFAGPAVNYDVKALFQRAATGDTWWATPPRGNIGTYITGDKIINAGALDASPITRIIVRSTTVTLNVNERNVFLNTVFTSSSPGAAILQTPTKTVIMPYSTQFSAAGGSYVNFKIPEADRAAIAATPSNSRFIFAMSTQNEVILPLTVGPSILGSLAAPSALPILVVGGKPLTVGPSILGSLAAPSALPILKVSGIKLLTVDSINLGSLAAPSALPISIIATSPTMWVVDSTDKKLYAYDLATGAYDNSEDFITLDDEGNDDPTDICSDGITMWVADSVDNKLYAYNLLTKARDENKEIDLIAANGNPTGIWTNGTTMWVADFSAEKIYAYTVATGSHDRSKDYGNELNTASNVYPYGIWSDGSILYVADDSNFNDEKIFAYGLTQKRRSSPRDFNTLVGAGNEDPRGIYSDGTTMWVADADDDKLYAYNLLTKARDDDKDIGSLTGSGHPYGIWASTAKTATNIDLEVGTAILGSLAAPASLAILVTGTKLLTVSPSILGSLAAPASLSITKTGVKFLTVDSINLGSLKAVSANLEIPVLLLAVIPSILGSLSTPSTLVVQKRTPNITLAVDTATLAPLKAPSTLTLEIEDVLALNDFTGPKEGYDIKALFTRAAGRIWWSTPPRGNNGTFIGGDRTWQAGGLNDVAITRIIVENHRIILNGNDLNKDLRDVFSASSPGTFIFQTGAVRIEAPISEVFSSAGGAFVQFSIPSANRAALARTPRGGRFLLAMSTDNGLVASGNLGSLAAPTALPILKVGSKLLTVGTSTLGSLAAPASLAILVTGTKSLTVDSISLGSLAAPTSLPILVLGFKILTVDASNLGSLSSKTGPVIEIIGDVPITVGASALSGLIANKIDLGRERVALALRIRLFGVISELKSSSVNISKHEPNKRLAVAGLLSSGLRGASATADKHEPNKLLTVRTKVLSSGLVINPVQILKYKEIKLLTVSTLASSGLAKGTSLELQKRAESTTLTVGTIALGSLRALTVQLHIPSTDIALTANAGIMGVITVAPPTPIFIEAVPNIDIEAQGYPVSGLRAGPSLELLNITSKPIMLSIPTVGMLGTMTIPTPHYISVEKTKAIWTWPYIQESPAVKAAVASLDIAAEKTLPDKPLDVRIFVAPDTIPLDNLITEVETRRIPPTEFLGETFGRRVYREMTFYYSNRNRFSGINRFSDDAQFSYIKTWLLTGVTRTGISICVSPSPFVDADKSYVSGVTKWIEWLLPHFEGNVKVIICNFADADLKLNVGATVTIYKTVEATERS